jgi:superfamily II DNA/RNA helicase
MCSSGLHVVLLLLLLLLLPAHVRLQVEPPKDPETYIHRSGRTGRAGHTGVCITLVGRKHEDRIPWIEKKAGAHSALKCVHSRRLRPQTESNTVHV